MMRIKKDRPGADTPKADMQNKSMTIIHTPSRDCKGEMKNV